MSNFKGRALYLLAALSLFCTQLQAQDLSAVTEWAERVTLSSVSSGMLTKVNVAVGDEVAKGDLLLELDQRGIRSSLAAAESRSKAARLLNSEAKRELDRAMELYDRTLLSDHERKLAEIEAAKAEAEFRRAESQLVEARLRREFSRIRAPFDGVVLAVHVQPGQAVINRLNAMPLVTLASSPRMKVVTQVDGKAMAGLNPGDDVQVGVRGQWQAGKITGLGLQPVAQAGDNSQYRIEVLFTPSREMRLRAGEQAVVRLPDE
jgi:multidrug efflux system membrane fusion protein